MLNVDFTGEFYGIISQVYKHNFIFKSKTVRTEKK